MKRFPLVLISAVILTGAAVTPAAASPARDLSQGKEDATLDVVDFNVLAPIWAAPEWYPADMDMSLLDTEYRRARVTDYLEASSATAEVVCLQEVQQSELPYLRQAIGSEFSGGMAHNDRDFWSNWVVPELGWAPNGTAVFVRTSVLSDPTFTDLPTGDGNHIALISATHEATGQQVRVASVHLDSDSNTNRLNEIRALRDAWPKKRGTTDIVCGDINEDTIIGSASGVFDRMGFVDVLASVGNREWTHPWHDSYNMSKRWGIIDHILVRNGTPLDGDVIDSGVWSIEEETARIEANFRRIGSDHFPVEGSLRVP